MLKTDKIKIDPFVKWAGGKSQLLNQFEKYLPAKNSYKRFVEPMIGGGALFFYLAPKQAIISDSNTDLINTYKVVKSDVKTLIKILSSYKQRHSKEFYLKIRNDFNHKKLNSLYKAAALIYLNKTCFNGLYRVNRKGEFNVPFGQHKTFSFNENNLIRVNKLLKNIVIKNESFEKVASYAKKGDFLYFDPPYFPLTETSKFTSYTKEDFLVDEQIKLYQVFKKLDAKGCKVMLSNSDTPFIRTLYMFYKNSTSQVHAKRFINCIGEKRGEVNELVIRNYK